MAKLSRRLSKPVAISAVLGFALAGLSLTFKIELNKSHVVNPSNSNAQSTTLKVELGVGFRGRSR
jgi:hypothetical protein